MRRGMPPSDQIKEPLLEVLARRDLGDRAGGLDLTVVDDGDMAAHLLHHRHDM